MRRHSSSAQPVQIARQAADTARNAAQSVDVSDVRDTLTAQASRVADVARDASNEIDLTEIRDAIATQAARATAAAREAAQNVDVDEIRDSIRSEVARDVDFVVDETRQRPVRSLLIALGAGVVVGAVLDRAAKRRKQKKAPKH